VTLPVNSASAPAPARAPDRAGRFVQPAPAAAATNTELAAALQVGAHDGRHVLVGQAVVAEATAENGICVTPAPETSTRNCASASFGGANISAASGSTAAWVNRCRREGSHSVCFNSCMRR
jgi:hypothetical protein